MRINYYILFGLILIVLISGCVTEDEIGPGDGEKTDCPYECCTDDTYKHKACPAGYECEENACVQEEIWGDEVPYHPEVDSSISWVSMDGPPGGRIKQLIQNPSPPHELYVVTVEGVRKSVDKGESWQLMRNPQSIPGNVHSMALSEDKLFFVCDDGLYYYDSEGNPIKVSDEHFGKIIVSDNKLFMISTGEEMIGVKIVYADMASDDFDWKDISLSESELSGLVLPPGGKGIEVQGIVALGNRILAGVNEIMGDRGELSKSYLYVSEDLGETWSMVELGTPDGVIISKIVQNPDNPRHIVLSFKYNIIHEYFSPLSELLKESYDGGNIWSPVTDLTLESNGVEDVVISGSSYYLLNPYGGGIIKLTSSGYEKIDEPKINEFEEINFNLDALLIDYENPNIAYGKTGSIWALGMVKSEDGMKTWKKMDSDIIGSSPTIVMTHPTDPNVVFTSGNVIQESYVTRNSGITWEPFTPVAAGDDVKIDPHNPNHILLADEMTNMYESFDAGRTFTRIAQDFSSAKIFDFEIAEDGSAIYASNIGVGISEASSQGGWRYLTYSPDYTYDIEIDPEDSNFIYAAYSPKIFENHSSVWRYSKNQQENSGWSEIFRVEDSRGVTSLAIDESNPDNMYAGVVGEEGTVYASNDKGQNWDKLNEDLSFTTIWGHSQLQIDPTDKSTVYVGTWGGGSYKTTDGGESWTMLDEDHTFSPVCLAISGKNPSIVYACDRTAPKIHKSTDGGETWTEYYDFGRGYMLSSAVAIDPDDPDMIYASAFKPPMAHEGGLVAITGGQATPIGEDLPRSVLEIEIDPANKNIIYVTTHIHGVYKSEDAGMTWEKLDDQNNGLPRIGIYDIDIDPANSNILHATALCGELPDYMMPPPMLGIQNLDPDGKCGVYKSTDAGENWELLLETISEARGIDVDTEDNNNLYVADMMGGVWVSNDAGQTWRQENEGLGSISMTSVKVNDDYIYASTQGSGVYSGTINNDGSITWNRARSNKPKAYVYKIQVEVDPANSDRIYASAYPGGLLRSDDGGEHWNDKNFLTPSIKVDDPFNQGYYRFDINPENPEIVWMGVFGQGMFVSYDGMDFNMFANGDDNVMRGKHITSVKINPANPDEVYAGTQGEGVFVTRDGGETWEGMNEGLKTSDILSLKAMDIEYPPLEDDFEDGNADGWRSEAGWSVIRESGNYVLQGISHDWISAGLESWTDYTFESRVKLIGGSVHINYRVSGNNRYAIGINSGSLYLMRSSSKENDIVHTELRNVNMQFNNNVWYDIKIVGKGNNIKVYVGDVLKIDYTDNEPVLNGGIAFETLQERIHVDNVVVTIDSTGADIYAGTAGYGIYKFNPASREWQNLGKSFGSGWWSPWERRMYQFSSILFDPDVPGKVYFGHFPSGFFISEDNGHTWRDSSLGLGNDGMFSLSMHPHNHSILFAGTYNGVVKSLNKGRTWEMISNGMPPEQWPYTVAIDSDNPDIMYTSTKNGQNKGFCDRNEFCGIVMKTTDGGENWFRIMNGLYGRSEFYTLLIYPPNHDILFLSTNQGVYMSRDAGASWKIINSGLPGEELTVDNQVRDNVADNLALTPDNRYLVFGLTEYGVWKADLSQAGF